jgi:hypothetical protein
VKRKQISVNHLPASCEGLIAEGFFRYSAVNFSRGQLAAWIAEISFRYRLGNRSPLTIAEIRFR